jgi:hypothetical protein
MEMLLLIVISPLTVVVISILIIVDWLNHIIARWLVTAARNTERHAHVTSHCFGKVAVAAKHCVCDSAFLLHVCSGPP